MHILEKLTLQNLRENRRRTIVTVIGVMLSSALILAVVGMVTSFQKMMLNFAIAETGEYMEVFDEVPASAIEYVTKNQHVKSHFFSAPVSAEKIGEDAMESYQEYPTQPYERSDYEVISELPSGSEKQKYNVYVNYDNPRDYKTIHDQILATLYDATGEKINLRVNSNLLRAYGVMSDQALSTIYWLAAIIISIIVITSVFVIRNSFSISATERSRQFGMLASIGATPRQIRHSVLFEGFVIGLISIPLGLILGAIAVAILVVIVNALMQGMIVGSLEFSLPLWIFPVVIALSFITVFLSSLAPATRTSRMPAIEAIRGSHDIKIKAKKLRTPKLVNQVFGIGGVIAAKNLKRSKKKYRTTVISIVLSVATFVGLSSFVTYGKKTINMEYNNSPVEAIIYGGDRSLYQDVVEKFSIKDYAYYEMAPSAGVFQLVLMNEASFADFADSLGIKAKDINHLAIANNQILNRSDDGSLELTATKEVQEGKDYTLELLRYACRDYEDETGKHETCGLSDENGTDKIGIPITKVTNALPLGFEDQIQPTIFVSENYYQRGQALNNDHLEEYSRTFVAKNIPDIAKLDEYMAECEEQKTKFPYLHYANIFETRNQMQRMILLMEIFLYGFIIVVTLIGVTNIFNTITTNIALRAKEFAMLKSIGMTDYEFNRMVRLESLMYAGKALVIGIPIGIVISYGLYQSIANSIDFGFVFPWPAILISIAGVSLLVAAIMRYSVRQVEKQNIIETIRSENV